MEIKEQERGRVYGLLTRCGFQLRHQGTRYLMTALELYEPGMQMTKELYPAIAKQHGTTACRVERSIRHAIAEAAVYGHGHDHDHVVGTESGRPISEVLARLDCTMNWGVW